MIFFSPGRQVAGGAFFADDALKYEYFSSAWMELSICFFLQ